MDLTKEIVDKHSTEEIIAYLSKMMNGIIQNYKLGFQTGRPEALWGSFGDIVQVSELLREMKRRNAERDALKEA